MPLNERHRLFSSFFATSLLCATALIPLIPAKAQAIGFYGNQSDIQWKTAGTEHFQFIYPAEYSEHAAAVSAYAEAVYDSVVSRYRIDLPGRVNVSLNNALYSNGNAVPSENSVHLWLTNWDFKVRSSHGWISDVVTHEFSHLVSIESGSKILPNIYGFQVGYSDYYNERTTTDFLSLFPFTLQPLWLAEGTAQYESSRMGFDSWDTHRDMLLRVAALNDDLLSLEYMHNFSSNSLYAELGPYNQGFSLVRYISKHYGESAVPKIWSELSRFHRVTLDAAIEKVLGLSEKELYNAWKKEITEQYQAQKDSLGTLVEGTKLTEDAFWQDFPIVAGKHIYGISNFGGDWFDGGIFKMPLGDETRDERRETRDTAEVVDGVEIGKISIEDSSIIDITEYAKSGFKAKKAWFDKGIDVYEDSLRGPILAYISYQNRDKKGHAHFDVFVCDTNKNQVSVTYLTDAVYPAIDKQGTSVAFARRENASTRFVLSKAPFPKDFDEYVADDPVDLFVPDAKYRYYNIYSPKFSPDGKRIAFGFFDDTTRGIAIIDSDGKNHKIVSNADYDERDVEWLDNDKIVFASNRNGIFNLFEKSLSTGTERPLTNVVGGAFTPVLSGDTIFFTQYDKDGFSLYKIGYKNGAANAPVATKDSIVVTIRDSVVKVADTTWSTCPEVKDSTQADSAACVPQATVATRDSTIKVEVRDTVKVAVGDSTSKDAPIVLHGSLPKRIQKPLNLENREFAGAEKNYRPLPILPLFVPMLMFSENAPDLTVFGEGELKTKAGLAVILSDPLKKNTVQLGLLLELGNGYDYINSDGLNPRQEKEFFASWQNTSTPLDLGLAYSYANYTSKDTVRNEDVRSENGDSLSLSHYAMSLQNITGLAGYSIFKSIDTLQLALSYGWSDFNFYDLDEYDDSFTWTYQKQISAILGFGLYGDHEDEDGTGISGQGNGLFVYYQYTNSDLYRPGTFSESFYVTESGFAKPKYRNFNINEVGLNLYGSLQLPVTGTRVAAGGKINVIAKWNTDAKQDTLDSYYYNPIFLEGYPYLRSSESYTLAGTRTAMAELHLLQSIYDDWRNSFWIFETRDFYIDLFAQIGSAWNSKLFDMDKFKDHNFWDRSVGLSFRMSNKIFYNVPLDISLTLARGLNRIGESNDTDRSTSRKLNPIDLPVIPDAVSPTRIKLNIGMGFANTWQ